MTNHWIDFKNTDVAMIIGSNIAENHPVGMRWLLKAREERGARIISVDPRFTRTSSKADLYAPMRSGTDIAFIGGLINYALQNNKIHREYVVNYTNAAFLVDDGYSFKDGLFSGFDEQKKSYDKTTWAYKNGPDGKPLKDPTLENPRTVFQLMKEHYSRYDPDTVSKVTGMPRELFLKIAETFCSTGAPDKTGTILYAMGGTQHTVGSQNVRAYAVLQLLLGNIGRPGGGVNALRGLSNVQGSTDLALLFNNLPGYLGVPNDGDHPTLKDYNEKETPKAGYWTNKPKFLVSLLKAWWGPAATKENDFAYQYLPKVKKGKNHSHIAIFECMYAGEIKGLFCWGQNPVGSGPNSNLEARALEKLEWMVVSDLFETETATFWKRPGADPKAIKTEVFLLPAASVFEKEGCVTNSGRLLQWRSKAIEPLEGTRTDLWIIHNLARRFKAAYAASDLPQDEPIKNLFWSFGDGAEPGYDLVAREMNGYVVETGEQLATFGKLADDGTTASGCWIYCGFYPSTGNRSRSRGLEDPGGLGYYLKWGFAWPVNRRILYNRAGADPEGRPWAKGKETIWWDEAEKKWKGYDVPDFKPDTAPDNPAFKNPFIMNPEGVGRLFAPGMAEGPFPEHYEPYESPVKNLLSPVQYNPVIKIWKSDMDKFGTAEQFPIVASTWRLSEHMHTGAVTRRIPWLVEMIPEPFVEMSPSLAEARGIKHGDWVIVASARGEVRVRALVTSRIKPLRLNGRVVEHVGLPWHWGYQGLKTGDIVNRLTPHIGDANTMIPEYKAFLVDVRKG